jgi:hypothetical protein
VGLTVHYKFSAPGRTVAAIRPLVERLRRHALTLPFKKVTDLFELKHKACEFRGGHACEPHAWLKVQTIRFSTREKGNTIYSTDEEHPVHIVAFTVFPGDGCEPANFGLCKYPGNLKDWSWSSFCKTQYASNPTAGDMANFLKCHLSLVALLDKAREMEILGEVHDEGQYWDKRDLTALVKTVGVWNEMTAGFYGQFRDAVEAAGGDPRGIVAAIAKFTNFEQIEMKACQRKR